MLLPAFSSWARDGCCISLHHIGGKGRRKQEGVALEGLCSHHTGLNYVTWPILSTRGGGLGNQQRHKGVARWAWVMSPLPPSRAATVPVYVFVSSCPRETKHFSLFI